MPINIAQNQFVEVNKMMEIKSKKKNLKINKINNLSISPRLEQTICRRRPRSGRSGKKKFFLGDFKSGMTPRNWGKSAVPGCVGKKN